MTGLIAKDIRLIKNQKSFGLIFAAIIVFYLFTDVSAPFIIGYACLVGMIFVVGTISYDELDNGNAFLFTLPFERKTYVREKYLLTALASAAVWVFAILAAAAAAVIRGSRSLSGDQMILPALLILASTLFFASVMLPVQLKFGGNRGVLALIFSCLACALIFIIAARLLDFLGIDARARLNLLLRALDFLTPAVLSAICLAVSAVCLFLSHLAGIRIVERKEF